MRVDTATGGRVAEPVGYGHGDNADAGTNGSDPSRREEQDA